MRERLQKILARAGFGSRRKCEETVRDGRVTVDGRLAGIGDKADLMSERVAVDGQEVEPEPLEYWLLNKAPGVISTASDPQGRPTVVDSVTPRGRIYPVGRLDQDTTGVLILTNDGALTNSLLHPSHAVEKEYVVVVEGTLAEAEVEALRSGVVLEDGRTAPAGVTVTRANDSETECLMVIHEGRKRQIKRMLLAVGHRVLHLHRRSFGGVCDRGLETGATRPLLPEEVEKLRKAGGLLE